MYDNDFTKTHERRLLKLAAFLRNLPRKKFNFGIEVQPKYEYMGDMTQKELVEGLADVSCKTVGCAMGHATTMPSFRKLGARDPRIAMSYVALLFGDRAGRKDLFWPNVNPEKLPEKATPLQVAKAIEDFCKKERQ